MYKQISNECLRVLVSLELYTVAEKMATTFTTGHTLLTGQNKSEKLEIRLFIHPFSVLMLLYY